MLKKITSMSLLLIALIALVGALGCTGGGSPATPVDTSAGVQMNDSNRAVADGVLNGTLTDPSGDPLAWAELYVDGEFAGWTGEDGSYTIYGVDAEEVSLEAVIDGETVFSSTVSLADRSAQATGDGDPNIERGKAWGFVKDQLGPVPHALVVIFNKNENFGVDFTNEKGYYEIPDAPAGLCAIVGFAPNHGTAKDAVYVIANGEVQKNLFLPAKLDKGVVGGVVVTGPLGNGKPVPFALITMKPIGAPGAQPIFTHTNKFGAYMYPPVPLGPHAISAEAPCLNKGFQVFEVHPGQNYVNFHLEPVGCGGLEGQVKDPAGHPISQAIVKAVLPNPNDPGKPLFVVWMPSNELGLYKFAPLPPGKYLLTCEKPGFKPFHQEVPVFPDQKTVKDIVLQPVDGGGGG